MSVVSKSDECDAENKEDSAVIEIEIQEMLQKIPRICHQKQKANQTTGSELFDLQSGIKIFSVLRNTLGDYKKDLILAISVHLAVNGSSDIMDKMLKIQFNSMNLNDISFEEYCRSYFKAKRIIEPKEKKKEPTAKSGIHVSNREFWKRLNSMETLKEEIEKAKKRERESKKKERETLKKKRKQSERNTLKDLCW